MATVEKIEYYVRYTDTRGRKLSSSFFLSKDKAQEFANSMLSHCATQAEVVEFRYYYND